MRRAVIDIGTNSVKLLVAEVEGDSVTPVLEQSEQTRLGEGFYLDHRLRPGPILQTAQAVARFAKSAATCQARSTRAIATSAARDAVNQAELLQAIQAASGLTVEVITGEQEADWVYRGVRTHPALPPGRLLILDVGGGSTEFILGAGPHLDFRGSFPIGSVRLAERIQPGDPPSALDWNRCESWLAHFMEAEVRPRLRPHLAGGSAGSAGLVATGGTASILAAMELGLSRFDRDRMEGLVLPCAKVMADRRRLWAMTLAERRQTPGIPPNRADIILFGVAVMESVMASLGFAELRVSTRGLRFGAVAA